MYFGRQKILTDETEITNSNVVEVLRNAYIEHSRNSTQIDYLYNYYKGNQPILRREKDIRPEICNKIVENRAYEIVSFKTGYLCGEPLQCVSRGADEKAEDISALNEMFLLCGKAARDKEVAEWMYIAGQGYRMVIPNGKYIKSKIIPAFLNKKTEFSEDEAPFNIYTLDPRFTFCVYTSALGEECLMGVKYIIRNDNRRIFSVYTNNRYYEIENDVIIKNEPSALGNIPIVEYPLNNARIGSFEIVLEMLDAINDVQSNRLDGIEQFIQSLWVLYNAEIDEEDALKLRQAGLISLKSFGENNADIKVIAEQLNQTQTQTLIDYMYQTVLNIVGKPNRNGGTSTSDTGSAVIMRDGWESAEARAKSDEMMFKEAERKFLKVVLRIMRDTVGTSLKLSDIEVRFTRRNYENIVSKANVLVQMLSNDKIEPTLAFEHCGLFIDPNNAAEQSKRYYESVKAELARQTKPIEQQKAGDAIA